ncbi:aldehyde dehydrogenase family protein, partial [Acinetobacter baumannii]|uniref:aldehyde dehydrogenase family protein n=1 Tax=Acinetobacter baumannii TaxID=470 RepID=UPI002891DBBE
KPSELSARQTELLTRVLHRAEVPAGLFNILTGRGDVVGAAFVRHPGIAKISFTGSTAVGKSIVRGSAETLKRVTLELGGKSPLIIADDADLDLAADIAMMANFYSSGQVCTNGTRVFVPAKRKAEFEHKILE